ncbi:hypothetical protein FE275_10795 [Pseudomonas koreensis]|jgi:hypothetical protein|uniref:hypothetical protein n=1 Tax=Pseudomonas TaxID=286 RepID=UPI00123B39AA|nr:MULTISPECIES: hypothetical protein [Pseudomonas]KAA8740434.1 hypothetical protein FE275_10795 [Pseudomonas koreensis]
MGIPAKHPSKAQDGLRGFCGALDDILMTGQGRFSEFAAVMTLSLSGDYPDPNTSRVLKVFAASLGSFFFARDLASRAQGLQSWASLG